MTNIQQFTIYINEFNNFACNLLGEYQGCYLFGLLKILRKMDLENTKEGSKDQIIDYMDHPIHFSVKKLYVRVCVMFNLAEFFLFDTKFEF